MPIRRVSKSNSTTTHIVDGVSTGNNTKVKRVTLGKPIRRVYADNGNLVNLNDVDAYSAEDGDVLVWQDEAQKWVAQKLLDKQIINGGQY